MNISIKLGRGATMPTKAHPDDAGWDIYARDVDGTPRYINPGMSAAISTGVSVDIPPGYYGQLATRSSMAARDVFVMGGVIDAGYHGDIVVILFNAGSEFFDCGPYRKIAQLLILPVPDVQWQPVDALPDSERGEAGFGSSDKDDVYGLDYDPRKHMTEEEYNNMLWQSDPNFEVDDDGRSTEDLS